MTFFGDSCDSPFGVSFIPPGVSFISAGVSSLDKLIRVVLYILSQRFKSFITFQVAGKAEKKMPSKAGQTITLIHFNDVYNVESRGVEPVGGAARFLTAVKELQELNPLILFSGDIFAPSISKYQSSAKFNL